MNGALPFAARSVTGLVHRTRGHVTAHHIDAEGRQALLGHRTRLAVRVRRRTRAFAARNVARLSERTSGGRTTAAVDAVPCGALLILGAGDAVRSRRPARTRVTELPARARIHVAARPVKARARRTVGVAVARLSVRQRRGAHALVPGNVARLPVRAGGRTAARTIDAVARQALCRPVTGLTVGPRGGRLAAQHHHRVVVDLRNREVDDTVAGEVANRHLARAEPDEHLGGEIEGPIAAPAERAHEAGGYTVRFGRARAHRHRQVLEAVAIEVAVLDVLREARDRNQVDPHRTRQGQRGPVGKRPGAADAALRGGQRGVHENGDRERRRRRADRAGVEHGNVGHSIGIVVADRQGLRLFPDDVIDRNHLLKVAVTRIQRDRDVVDAGGPRVQHGEIVETIAVEVRHPDFVRPLPDGNVRQRLKSLVTSEVQERSDGVGRRVRRYHVRTVFIVQIAGIHIDGPAAVDDEVARGGNERTVTVASNLEHPIGGKIRHRDIVMPVVVEVRRREATQAAANLLQLRDTQRAVGRTEANRHLARTHAANRNIRQPIPVEVAGRRVLRPVRHRGRRSWNEGDLPETDTARQQGHAAQDQQCRTERSSHAHLPRV